MASHLGPFGMFFANCDFHKVCDFHWLFVITFDCTGVRFVRKS